MTYLDQGSLSENAHRAIHALRQAAYNKLRPAMAAVIELTGDKNNMRLVEELTGFCLLFLNGCFIEHQIDPERNGLNRRLTKLTVALIAVATEFANESAAQG
jgi:hypothetical protein